MSDAASAGVPVALPEPVLRPMRIGPFPGPRDALKFFAYVAAGVLLAAIVAPWLWVPLVAGGFVLAVYQPDGQPIDDRLRAFVAWKLRARRRAAPAGPSEFRAAPGPHRRRGRYVSAITVGGIPVAFLPPTDARSVYERYRETLRAAGDGLAIRAGVRRTGADRFRPQRGRLSATEEPARRGYDEMIRLLFRRRARRVVRLELTVGSLGASALHELEGRRRQLVTGLAAMGLAPLGSDDAGAGVPATDGRRPMGA